MSQRVLFCFSVQTWGQHRATDPGNREGPHTCMDCRRQIYFHGNKTGWALTPREAMA
jgi:hypothetical protein